jgi:predicted acylesterase/phospholipase RssA
MTDKHTKIEGFRIALCLSGGGFRATFFHLGVIRFLRDAGMLSSVTQVFSVSGGSIIAAHLAKNWSLYSEPPRTSDDGAFYQASSELVRFGLSDLRGRIARRFLLFGWLLPAFGLSRQLARFYDHLLGKAELGELPVRPNFHFLSTSLTTGDCCAFTRDGFVVYAPEVVRRYHAPDLPLGFAVAASSAFPPLFPPLSLKPAQVHAKVDELGYEHRLTDGGVFDNIGIRALQREQLHGEEEKVSVIVVSDASGLFDMELTSAFANLVARNVRATNVLMNRVAFLEKEACGRSGPTMWLSIGDIVLQTAADATQIVAQDLAVQKELRFVRTDLDGFTREEIRALTRHGYEVAWKNFLSAQPPKLENITWAPWDPIPAGWPDYKKISAIRAEVEQWAAVRRAGLRMLDGLINDLGHQHMQDSISAITPTRLDSAETLRLMRQRVKAGGRRRLGLWNAKDPASWMLLTLACLPIACAFAWLWRALT